MLVYRKRFDSRPKVRIGLSLSREVSMEAKRRFWNVSAVVEAALRLLIERGVVLQEPLPEDELKEVIRRAVCGEQG